MDEQESRISHDEMGLTDLAEAAGVSVRTVRYYIAEGLLPPPTSAGPRAAYTAEHLDRLRLIARLKGAYLPLREIRRRLRGLDADAVRALLTEDAVSRPEAEREPSPARSAQHGDDSAAAYLSRLLPRRDPRMASFAPEPASPASVGKPARPPEQTYERAEPDDPSDPASLTRADLDRGATLAAFDALAEPDATPAESWHRLRLGDDAELLIRADAYDRQRGQIDALVAWARRILG